MERVEDIEAAAEGADAPLEGKHGGAGEREGGAVDVKAVQYFARGGVEVENDLDVQVGLWEDGRLGGGEAGASVWVPLDVEDKRGAFTVSGIRWGVQCVVCRLGGVGERCVVVCVIGRPSKSVAAYIVHTAYTG